MAMKKHLGLLPKLMIAIIIGVILGSSKQILNLSGFSSEVYDFFIKLLVTFKGLFSTFLSFVIPLLIVSFVTVGLAELGKKANNLFKITIILAYVSTIFAGFTAYFLGIFILPNFITSIVATDVTKVSFTPLFTIEIAPLFGVMTALVLAFVLGLGIANNDEKKLFQVINELQQIIIKVLEKIIIPLIPYYIAASFAQIAASGELFATIKIFAELFVMILVFQWLYILVQFLISSVVCKKNNFKNLINIFPAYVTAVGTQSSAATIPVNLQCAKKNNISEDIRDFVIPLGATIHLAGDTICLVIGAIGIMLMNGVEPTLALFTPFILMLGVTMVAAPGVPGGGVMAAIGIIESILGFTTSMQSLIIALHFSQDSFGTATNITGDQAIAMIVDHLDQQ